MAFTIHPVTDNDRPWVLDIIRDWGADFIVSRGRCIYAAELDAYYAADESGRKIGLVTFEIIGNQCEVVTLDAFEKYRGVGTALLFRTADDAAARGCTRLWLIAINDNLDALRFYQKRGMTIATIHVNALKRSRELKPSIPLVGNYGIPIRDEIEFEMSLPRVT